MTKPGGAVRYQGEDFHEWISTAYMQRDLALEGVKALIDAGGLK